MYLCYTKQSMPKSKRGFASMKPEKRRAAQSRGGVSAHKQGKAHEWTREEAKIAGMRGGLANSIFSKD